MKQLDHHDDDLRRLGHRPGGRRTLIARIATGLTAVAAAVGVSAGPTDAGGAPPTVEVTINVQVAGSQASEIATYTPTFTPAGGGALVGSCTSEVISVTFIAVINYTCAVLVGDTYTVTVPTPPEPFVTFTQCTDSAGTLELDGSLEVYDSDPDQGCILGLVAPTVAIDKGVFEPEGFPTGPLGPSDFELEVFAADGTLIGTAFDPSAESCASATEIGTNCAYLEVPFGSYVLGEVTLPGYVPVIVTCTADPFGDGGDPDDGPIRTLPSERIDDPNAAFTLSDDLLAVFCEIGNVYVEGTIEVTKTVINDDGGTATPDDWTVELYDADGALVTSSPCTADGACLSGSFPVGEYTVGEVGPDGYTSSVSVTITEPDEPITDPDPDPTFPFPTIPLSERLDDPDATFDLTPLGSAAVEIVSDDVPAGGSDDASSGVTLPATGSGDRSVAALLAALALMVLGLASVRTVRR